MFWSTVLDSDPVTIKLLVREVTEAIYEEKRWLK